MSYQPRAHSDTAMPCISVVMAVYNAGRFVREAVGCILAQTYSDFELIAVDDASSDDSLRILESFDDPRMRIIRHAVNRGAALARNSALLSARGEFIAIMDADDLCAPTRFERQAAFLREQPGIGLVGCGIYENIDVDGVVLGTSVLPTESEAIQSTLLERWCFLHSSIMFRKELVELAGDYRSVFEPVEDYDLVLRILEHAQACNLPERLVSYRLNPQGLSASGNAYIGELSETVVRLARRRRSGQSEEFETEELRLMDMKGKRTGHHQALETSASPWPLRSGQADVQPAAFDLGRS